jgi:hypothetical protein
VPNGIRVLVLQTNGTPYNLVDQIAVAQGPPQSQVNLKNVPLTTIGPPASCQPILYHADVALPPSNTSGKNGSAYRLQVKIGPGKPVTQDFTLGTCEFKPLTITVP